MLITEITRDHADDLRYRYCIISVVRNALNRKVFRSRQNARSVLQAHTSGVGNAVSPSIICCVYSIGSEDVNGEDVVGHCHTLALNINETIRSSILRQ